MPLRSDQAKPLLFQGLFSRKRCYLALEAHFPIEMVAIRRHRFSKSTQAVRHRNLAMFSQAQFIFTALTNPSLPAAIDSDQRSTRRHVSARFSFDPFTIHPLKLWQRWVMRQARPGTNDSCHAHPSLP
jgi:hypothetical protein